MSAENNTSSFLDSLHIPDHAVLTELLEAFDQLFNNTLKKVSDNDNFEHYLELIQHGATPLINNIKVIGSFCYKKLHQKGNIPLSSADQTSYYLIDFDWIASAKSMMTLWRNVYFESQKAWILYLENKTDQNNLLKLRSNSLQAIQEAYDAHSQRFQQETDRINSSSKAIKKQNDQWAIQQNPFPIYYQQLVQLEQQITDLSIQRNLLTGVSNDFIKIKTLILEAIQLKETEFEAIHTNSKNAISFIKQEQEKLSRMNTHLDEIESQFSHLAAFDFLDRALKNVVEEIVGTSHIVVSARQGMLQRKEVNFQKNTRQWLDYEILPRMYRVWELNEQMKNALKLSFINIRNRIVMLSNERREGREININDHALDQPLVALLGKISEWQKEFQDLKEYIQQNLDQSFGVFPVFYPVDEFLPVPIELTIKKFRVHQSKWFVRGKNWLFDRLKAFQNLRTFVKQEEQLSTSEKIVRLIQSRKINLNENQYAGIFLTKGYIGESFLVGRKAELRHMEELIRQWELGFRGAVILSGKRFSGKTLFGDLVARRFFPKNTVRLQPNTQISIEGRQLNTSCDLEAALNFIKKYATRGSILVWIDDLELWSNAEYSLSRNVRKLNQFIDAQSKQMFFMVAMNNWTKHHYKNIHEIDKRFQTEINLDRMSKEEVQEAILIRHGATHRVLVNKEGTEESASFFRKNITKLYQSVEGNIGDTLLHWSLSIHKKEGEKIIFRLPESYFLPDLNDSDLNMVLSTLMMEKRTNEFRLNKLFGPAFKDKYASILKRLHSTGLLTRFADGTLEINETIVNDVGRLLERKNFLNFYYRK
jgi:hypothetical protein